MKLPNYTPAKIDFVHCVKDIKKSGGQTLETHKT